MKKWLVFAVVMSLSGVCSAQTKPMAKGGKPVLVSPVKQKHKKPPIAKFSMNMIESDRVDPGYPGMPLAEVLSAIEKMLGVKKGEFESTDDFNSRKSAVLSGKFLSDSSVEDIFAFVQPVAPASKYSIGLKYSFDPDTSEVRLFAFPRSSSMNGIGAPDYQPSRSEGKFWDIFTLVYKTESESTYQGSNAYGATVTVEKSVSSVLGIAVDRIPFLNFKRETIYSNPIPAAQFNLENAKAAKELPALKAILVMKLADPYIVYDFYYKEPKRDSPTETSVQHKYLTGNVLGIVFYSGLTGEVFARLPESFGKPEPTKVEDQLGLR